jgi:hypothetical protein
MNTVMAHIGYWLSNTPAVVQDHNAVKPLLHTVFIPALQKRHGKNANQKSIELEYQVLTYVREQMNALTDKTAEHLLDILPTSTEYDYNKRFDYSPWKDILILVHAMVGPHFENKVMTRFNREDPKTIKSKPLTTILHSICNVIGNSPEIAQSSVLSRKNAIQSLHDTLRPTIAMWAIEQYDKALEYDCEPAMLAQVTAERAKYTSLQDTEIDLANSPVSSYGGDSIDFLSEASNIPEPAAVLQKDVQEVATPLAQGEIGGTAPKRTSSGFVALRDRPVHFAGNSRDATDKVTPMIAQKDAPFWEIKSSSGRVGAATLPKGQSRGSESAKKGWRMRPVAQSSVQPQS